MNKQKKSPDERLADLQKLARHTDKEIRECFSRMANQPGRTMIDYDEYAVLQDLKKRRETLSALIESERQIASGDVLGEDQIRRKYARKS